MPAGGNLPEKVYQTVNRPVKKGKVLAAYTPGYGGWQRDLEDVPR